ncbi:hypothetical protein Misp01_10180 [Microtetraspora sp. NBRC 13810]|nr:hypothetical protein Misp01_10180 [Microtetraspora sp. NBRC 13810]
MTSAGGGHDDCGALLALAHLAAGRLDWRWSLNDRRADLRQALRRRMNFWIMPTTYQSPARTAAQVRRILTLSVGSARSDQAGSPPRTGLLLAGQPVHLHPALDRGRAGAQRPLRLRYRQALRGYRVRCGITFGVPRRECGSAIPDC